MMKHEGLGGGTSMICTRVVYFSVKITRAEKTGTQANTDLPKTIERHFGILSGPSRMMMMTILVFLGKFVASKRHMPEEGSTAGQDTQGNAVQQGDPGGVYVATRPELAVNLTRSSGAGRLPRISYAWRHTLCVRVAL